MKTKYDIIKFLYHSEKAVSDEGLNKYTFVVDKKANKIEIRNAVESIFNVKVKRINTAVMPSKPKRLRWGQEGKTSEWKKAVVTLEKGHKIDTGR